MADEQSSGLAWLTPDDLSNRQQETIKRFYEYDATLAICPTGFGKTATTLFAAHELIRDGHLNRVIVVAPAKVCIGWVRESLKWEGLNIHVATGVGLTQVRKMVDSTANILVISYESVHNLIRQNHMCDGIVFDEITRLKSCGGKTFKALRYKIKNFTWRVGLSATPLSENWEAVYGMTMMLDNGERFGRNNERFIQEYFYRIDFKGYDLELRPNADKQIVDKMRDLVYVVPESHKREKLPEPIHRELSVGALPNEIVELQKAIAKDNIAEVNGKEVLAANAAVVSGKLRQLAQGFVYSEDDEPLLLMWKGRLNVFESVIRAKLNNGPVVATYEFTACVDFMKLRFPDADVINGKTTKRELDDIRNRWSAGKGHLVFLQVKAGSHGLDFLQFSAWQMIHFAPIWSRDGWLQLAGRLDRTGQKHQVEVTTLMAHGTIDDMVRDRVENKGQVFIDFLNNL